MQNYDLEGRVEGAADELQQIVTENTPIYGDLVELTAFQRGVLLGIRGIILALWYIARRIES